MSKHSDSELRPASPKRKQVNVLFNDALNIFYLWLYGIGHKVKDHLAREETCCHHYMGRKVSYMHYFTDRIAYTMIYISPVVEHWLEWEVD